MQLSELPGAVAVQTLNVVHLDTPRGIRSLKLLNGDIAEMDGSDAAHPKADLLVLSAFADGYSPTPGTVIEALHRRWGIDLKLLAAKPEIDLIGPLGCWVSSLLDGKPFRRIVCVLGNAWDVQPDFDAFRQRIGHLFRAAAVAEAWDAELCSIAMPVLGAGRQGFAANDVIPLLLTSAVDALERTLNIATVSLVELDKEKAQALSTAMDRALQRRNLVLGDQATGNTTRLALSTELDAYEGHRVDPNLMEMCDELRGMLSPALTFTRLGNWVRRWLEALLFDALAYRGDRRLPQKSTLEDVLQLLKGSDVPSRIVNTCSTCATSGIARATVLRKLIRWMSL